MTTTDTINDCQNAPFKLGDAVTRPAFTNCFGKIVPEVTGLVVCEVMHVHTTSMAPYWRVRAHNPVTMSDCEGAARYFAKTESPRAGRRAEGDEGMTLKLWTSRVTTVCEQDEHDNCRTVVPWVKGWLDVCACPCHVASEADITARREKRPHTGVTEPV